MPPLPPTTHNPQPITGVLKLADIAIDDAAALLARHDLNLVHVAAGAAIPGCYWGEPEAGVIGSSVYARGDTPVHSLLHEACHLIVASPEKRIQIHTDASESQAEEDATCYLQIILGDALPGFGRARVMADMDAWGYTFRLGSARAWFEQDAEDACAWLAVRGLLPVVVDPEVLSQSRKAASGCGFNSSMQHTMNRESGRSVAHETKTADLLLGEPESVDVGALAERRFAAEDRAAI